MSLTAEQAQSLLDNFLPSFNALQPKILERDGIPPSGNRTFSEVRKQFIPNILLALQAIANGQNTFEPTMLIDTQPEGTSYYGIFTPHNVIRNPNQFLSSFFENHRFHDIFSRLTELFNDEVSLVDFPFAILYPAELFVDGNFRSREEKAREESLKIS